MMTRKPPAIPWAAALYFAFAAASVAAPTKVTLCDSQNPPYSQGEEDGSVAEGGLAVEIAEAVFERLPQATVEVRLTPWQRCLQAAKEGKMDGVLKLLRNDERAAYLAFTEEPIYRMEMVFFYLPERFPDGLHWEEISDLSRYRIGISPGSSYGSVIDGAIENGTLKADFATDAQNALKLAAGRIDLFPNDRIMGRGAVDAEGLAGKIVASDQSVNEEIIHLGLSKKSPALALLPEIDRVLKELWEEGVIDRILAGKGPG